MIFNLCANNMKCRSESRRSRQARTRASDAATSVDPPTLPLQTSKLERRQVSVTQFIAQRIMGGIVHAGMITPCELYP